MIALDRSLAPDFPPPLARSYLVNLQLNRAQADALRLQPRVLDVSPDIAIRFPIVEYREVAQSIDEGNVRSELGVLKLPGAGLTGDGVLIGIVDGGFDTQYPQDYGRAACVKNGAADVCFDADDPSKVGSVTIQLGVGDDAGGTKFVSSDGMIVRGNEVHDNYGAGLWWDGFNQNARIYDNVIYDNLNWGIFWELSYGGTKIHDNTLTGNGVGEGEPIGSATCSFSSRPRMEPWGGSRSTRTRSTASRIRSA